MVAFMSKIHIKMKNLRVIQLLANWQNEEETFLIFKRKKKKEKGRKKKRKKKQNKTNTSQEMSLKDREKE